MAEWTREIPGLTDLVEEFLQSEATGIEQWEKLKITIMARSNGTKWVATATKEITNRESRPEEALGGAVTEDDWTVVLSSKIFTESSNVAADAELKQYLPALRNSGNVPMTLHHNTRARFNNVMKRTPYRLVTKTRKVTDTGCYLVKLFSKEVQPDG